MCLWIIDASNLWGRKLKDRKQKGKVAPLLEGYP
jgi:hypothetical protein